MPKHRKHQRTVAGINDRHLPVFHVTTNAQAADAAWAFIVRGWYAIDGAIVRRKGELSEADQSQIDTTYQIQESFRRGKQAIYKKRHR